MMTSITFDEIALPGSGVVIVIARHPTLPDLVLNRETRRAIERGRWQQH